MTMQTVMTPKRVAEAEGGGGVVLHSLVGPFREFNPMVELPRWLDEYKWHHNDETWSQCARDWTPERLLDPHDPKVWRTRRPNAPSSATKLGEKDANV